MGKTRRGCLLVRAEFALWRICADDSSGDGVVIEDGDAPFIIPTSWFARYPAVVLRGPAVGRGWGPELAFATVLPMTYDETAVPVDEIGRHLVVARRKGSVWYVAGLCGEAGYAGGFMLDFLGRGGKWKARLFADGEKGQAELSEKTVAGGTWFQVRMDRNGGFALALEAAR